ncbi:hypothetical protein [Marinobacter sp. CA1]|uniref:hypothetical protein n=1 Tax=Marinobacter sp. CA1 TaxID=2817656 RepID=UPI001D08B0DA|nr:hypothetical protein [Marinobacter sp. CA1]UDL07096.1 hypothetical protein J2887_10240 [Marinobacter sp. CA1]
MLRGIAIAALIIAILAAAVLGPRWLMRQTPEDTGQGPISSCNLITEDCQWQSDGDQWQLALKELAFVNGQHHYHIELTTTANPERLHGVLRGESMYLGEYPVPLSATGEAGRWETRFTAPLCTVQDTMVWRIDLENRSGPLKNVPFRLIFEASGQ